MVDETSVVRRRYDRLSRMYNLMEKGMNYGLNKWRERLFSKIQGPKVLEVGVGTGANLPYYPEDLEVTGIDLSPGMLRYARKVIDNRNRSITLMEMDVQHLQFPDNTYDTVISTCVFCSVPNPVKGLREIRRVLKPGHQLLMIEHVLSCRFGVRQLMSLVNPAVVRLLGANINRETRYALERSGFRVEEEDLWFDILKMFVATSLKEP